MYVEIWCGCIIKEICFENVGMVVCYVVVVEVGNVLVLKLFFWDCGDKKLIDFNDLYLVDGFEVVFE